MKAKIRGTEIYYDIAGQHLVLEGKKLIEQPILFLLHGGPGGDHLSYKKSSAELSEDAQCVYIDQRGCGRSKKGKQKDYTLENNIEDLEALRKHLGLEQIALLGTSYGGVVSQGYAIRYPHRVAKLILVVTAPSYRFLKEAKAKIAEIGTKEQIALCEDLWAGNFKNRQHLERFMKTMDPIYSVKAKGLKNKTPTPTLWSHEAINQGFKVFLRHYDFLPQLKKLRCPTLVLAGDRDWITSANQSRQIAKAIPKAKLKVFKNCGHSIAIDAHKGYIKEIQKFLRK